MSFRSWSQKVDRRFWERLEERAGGNPETLVQLAIRHGWRVIVFVVGSTVVLIGVAMIVLPGPATVVIPAGLAILATEFVWARVLLRQLRAKAVDLGNTLFGKPAAPPRETTSTDAAS